MEGRSCRVSALHFLADLHVGNHRGFASPTSRPGVNTRAAAILDVLAEVGSHIGYNDTLVILGDLFDTDRPSPQVLAAVMRALDDLPMDRPSVVCLRGNHDSSTSRPGDNALGPLAAAGFTVVEEPRLLGVNKVRLALLPFRPDPPSTWVADTLAGLCPDTDDRPLIVGSHFGLSDEETAEYLRDGALSASTAADLCERFSTDAPQHTHFSAPVNVSAPVIRAAWLSGDWHTRRSWWLDNVAVVQVGALVPTGFDNPGLTGYGSLWTFRDGRLSHRELAGPRFVKYRSAAAALAEPYAETCTTRYAQVTVKADDLEEARAELDTGVAAGRLAGFELVADRNEAIEEAGATAAYVATATSFDAALERSVERLDLPAAVNRGEVLRRARQRVAQGKEK